MRTGIVAHLLSCGQWLEELDCKGDFMKIEHLDTTLCVNVAGELSAMQAADFRDSVRAALKPQETMLDVDLAQITFIDSSGLAALIALHKTMCGRSGKMRVLQPAPPVLQILELTRLHQVMEIVRS